MPHSRQCGPARPGGKRKCKHTTTELRTLGHPTGPDAVRHLELQRIGPIGTKPAQTRAKQHKQHKTAQHDLGRRAERLYLEVLLHDRRVQQLHLQQWLLRADGLPVLLEYSTVLASTLRYSRGTAASSAAAIRYIG